MPERVPTNPVRVLLDATSIPGNRGGVARYLRELIPALARRDDVDLHVACQQRDVTWLTTDAPGATLHPVPTSLTSVPRRLLWEQTSLAGLARRIGADVLHCPHYTMPLLGRGTGAGVRTLVTLHDATFFSHPEAHGALKRRFFRFWIAWSLRRAAVCVVPSRATAHEVLRHTGITPRRAPVVAYHGVDTERYRPERAAEATTVLPGLGIDAGGYLAFVGTIEPRKNMGALLDAVALLRTRAATRDARLFVAGGAGWDDTAVARLRAGADGATWLGYVDEDALPVFLAASEAVVYPSVAEGFGLPVLEAMAAGVPVVTVPRLAIPEVGGDAALYCEPDATAIAATLESVLTDPDLRADRGRAGRERALGFTWDASAEQHVQAYRAAIAR